jgi:hypothetical protein
VQQHPDNDWIYWYKNTPNITWEIMQQHPDQPWSWILLSRRTRLDILWEIVLQHPDKPWDWTLLSYTPHITLEILQQLSGKPWDWETLSWCHSITWEIVKHFPKKWNWRGLCWNNMNVAREKYMQHHLAHAFAEWFIKSDVKRELMERLWHPRNMHKWSEWGHDILE